MEWKGVPKKDRGAIPVIFFLLVGLLQYHNWGVHYMRILYINGIQKAY